MKVLLDANIYISYLFASRPGGVISNIVERSIISKKVLLYLPNQLIEEVVDSISTKPNLRSRITSHRVQSVIEHISSAAIVPPPLMAETEHFVRDSKDDYLVAYALLVGADYLVTGDRDILVLSTVQRLQIVSPVQYWERLQREQYSD